MNIYDILLYKLPITILPAALFVILINGIRNELWSLKWVCLGLGITVFWFLNPILTDPATFPAGELSLIAMIQSGWKSGMLSLLDTPLWDDYFGNGHPLHADVLSSFFYPFNWLYLILEVNHAVSWSMALHFWFAAIFFAVLAREFNLSKTASYAAGFIYVMNEWVLTKIYSPILLYQFASIWLPIGVLYLSRYLKGKDRLYAIGGLAIAMAFSFIAFFNTFMYNFIILFIIFSVSMAVFYRNGNFRKPFFFLGIGISGILFFLLVSSTLLPSYELVQNTSNPRISSAIEDPGGLWPCYPQYCRSMGLSLPMMIDTFLARRDLLFGTHFGAGKLAALLALSGLLWIFVRDRSKERLYFYGCLVCVLIFGILVVRKTPIYYMLRQFLPYYDRTTLMPTALLMLVFSVSGLCGFGMESILFAAERILDTVRQKFQNIPKDAVMSALCILLAVGISAWNLRFMKFDIYDYKERSSDYPHLSEASMLIDHPLARISVSWDANTFTAWMGKIFVDYGMRTFDPNGAVTPIRESSVVNDKTRHRAFNRFLSLAGVQYQLSGTENDDLELAKTVVWKNWRRHNEAFDTRGLSGEKTVYLYKPMLMPQERYRIYRHAILILGQPEATGNTALMLMNNEAFDPMSTVILEIPKNELPNTDSALWNHIDLIVDTDLNGKAGADGVAIQKNIPMIGPAQIGDHAHLMKDSRPDAVPVIKHGNSYAVLDPSGLQPGILFAANTYFKGWETVAGSKKNQAIKANFAFQAYVVETPEIIRLRFRPGRIYHGMMLSVIGTVIILALAVYARYRKKTSSRTTG